MSAYSATLTDEVMTVARRAFERYDHDNSGTIQVEDICQALQEARRDVSEDKIAQVFEILDTLGLADGSSRVRFHEFLDLIDKTQPSATTSSNSQEEAEAIKNSFQWLGGDPEDASSKVSKDKLQQVLREFELNDNVDMVLGTASKPILTDVTLQDLTDVLTHKDV
mmetsp:Transcript_60024/g.97240  ORF Transcript_60024/g.97240 Transcript_60024/m.97240 type:complete len:166 (+) Transcript_60024:40-537(+)|eukprot:CAMPEP_0179443124 /NCGR_PEP_ID=MMETSP0799-20121207/26546_1 /TAXON_ID=46947 /ORGANISM="Geminigera cryophila, Strain CCMP2564" /LENGTH=165 /DNA_ID=CAMNT_0021228805 /DNA_START=39 /DNA_END=536 /DNA_ORIENTATION=+